MEEVGPGDYLVDFDWLDSVRRAVTFGHTLQRQAASDITHRGACRA